MRRFLYLLLPFIFFSCNEMHEIEQQAAVERKVKLNFAISEEKERFESRSILSESIEYKLTNITLAVYNSLNELVDLQYIESGFDAVEMLVDANASNNVYVLGNMGDMRSSFTDNEDDVASIEYFLGSYDEIEENGFPAAKMETISAAEESVTIFLDRLFAKINLRILHTGLSDADASANFVYNMCNKSLYLRQANSRLMPFASGGSKAKSVSDIIDISDYNDDLNDRDSYEGPLTPGQLGPGPGYLQDVSYVFYVPENRQGKLLPGNKDPYEKKYENLGSYADLCTYLEFNAEKVNTMGFSGDVMYRYYLGANNTTDFDIIRNCCYDLTLDFTEEGFLKENQWKICKGENWTDHRVLYFLEDPYTISPGGEENIMIHYGFSSAAVDSKMYPDKWKYVVDENDLAEAGLSISFDQNTLVEGENGYNDFCIKLSAKENAVVGSSIPIKIMTNDWKVEDYATISVVEAENEVFVPVWDTEPEYISQAGILSVSGYEESDLPLQISVSDENLATIISLGTKYSFRVVAKNKGNLRLTITNQSGTKSTFADINIKAPILSLESSNIQLNPDGESVELSFAYLTEEGIPIAMDGSVYYPYLRPVTSGLDYIASTCNSQNSMTVYLNKLSAGSSKINLGGSYNLEIAAVNCPAVEAVPLKMTVIDPFSGFTKKDYGEIHDYTLFSFTDFENKFSSEISENRSFSWTIPIPKCNLANASIEFLPKWESGFTNDNGVYELSADLSTGKLTLTQNVNSTVEHSAGLHELVLSVKNKHSSETISFCCAEAEIYVHGAIGALADFARQQSSYSLGSLNFAEIYNAVAGMNRYSTNTDNYINYMDVSMTWITAPDNVHMFKMLNNGSIPYGAVSFLLPSVDDGEIKNDMLYSVCPSSGDNRISVCGEAAGKRAGVGRVLYRALCKGQIDYEMPDADKLELMLGYKSGSTSAAYAPAYNLYDIDGNKVSSSFPYYFVPTNYKSYVDDSGHGYHVIHFLESIEENTYGWINLL